MWCRRSAVGDCVVIYHCLRTVSGDPLAGPSCVQSSVEWSERQTSYRVWPVCAKWIRSSTMRSSQPRARSTSSASDHAPSGSTAEPSASMTRSASSTLFTRSGMRLVADGGHRYELAEVRRFTAGWERDASLRLREGDPAALRNYRKHGRIIDGGTVEQAQAAAERAFLADTLAGRNTLLITDTNEQAARLSAKVRADLVRLGRVEEAGVPLGLQGTVAGVGDVVQARRNGWELAGYDGNHRAPINRERYRVLEVRDDGGLRVAPMLGGRDAIPGEPLSAAPADRPYPRSRGHRGQRRGGACPAGARGAAGHGARGRAGAAEGPACGGRSGAVAVVRAHGGHTGSRGSGQARAVHARRRS